MGTSPRISENRWARSRHGCGGAEPNFAGAVGARRGGAGGEERRVATRLAYWQRAYVPTPSKMIEVEPAARVWRQLERELQLARYRTPWHRRLGFWRGFAAAATAALALGI